MVGSRRRISYLDYGIVRKTLLKVYKEGDTIVSGGCPQGADHYAEQLASSMGASILIHYPNWSKYGGHAGFKRNTLIAQDSDILIACVAFDRKGGTEDTIRKFQKFHPKGKLILV